MEWSQDVNWFHYVIVARFQDANGIWLHDLMVARFQDAEWNMIA
jgi:hypothetical protein